MSATSALTVRALADSRARTASFALLFAAVAAAQVVGYRDAYPTRADRIAFARTFGDNNAIRLFYGVPHDLLSVGGYVSWRVGGFMSLFAAIWGVLAAVRALRTEEDTGRHELRAGGSGQPSARVSLRPRCHRDRRRDPLVRHVRRARADAASRRRIRVPRARGRVADPRLRRRGSACESARAESAPRARALADRGRGRVRAARDRRHHDGDRLAALGDAARVGRGVAGVRGAATRRAAALAVRRDRPPGSRDGDRSPARCRLWAPAGA